MALVNGGFLHYMDMKKFLGQFGPNLAGMFLGRSSSKMFTEFDSIKNSYCHGNEIEFFKQFFKNLQNRLSDFEIISQECSLGDTVKKLFAKF